MDLEEYRKILEDPIKFQEFYWPDIRLYDKQVEILYSIRDNDETLVRAGNQLGKDFIAGLACLWFFCSRSPAIVVTTSVDASQLEGVLWGEIGRFIQTAKYPLPVATNHLLLRQPIGNPIDENYVKKCYLIGRVTKRAEGMLGHHLARTKDWLPRTLAVFDEASGCSDEGYEASDTWAHRKLIIGNPRPCTNFFIRYSKQGDLKSPEGDRYYRKVMKITAQDSPNVRLAEKQIEAGITPTNEILIPGVLDYKTYLKRRETLDKVRQSWVLDAEFYEGAETLLYPYEWLERAEKIALTLDTSKKKRVARSMGVDPAEGGDDTVWTVVDDKGIIYQLAQKTVDTSRIVGMTVELIRRYKLEPASVFFDRGGGGKQHADYLRARGYNVQTVSFGSVSEQNPYRAGRSKEAKKSLDEAKYAFKNRRAQMYAMLREKLDPSNEDSDGFGIPKELTDLRQQLAPLPYLLDPEGRLYLPPKDKPTPTYTGETLRTILGRSPDHADSLVLAVYGLANKIEKRILAGH